MVNKGEYVEFASKLEVKNGIENQYTTEMSIIIELSQKVKEQDTKILELEKVLAQIQKTLNEL